MAQIDVFKRERGLAKKAQQAASRQPVASAPQPQPSEPQGPSFYDQTTTDLADWLRPQQGSINTQPRTVGVPQMPMEGPAMQRYQANPAFKPKTKLKNVAMRSPIYG